MKFRDYLPENLTPDTALYIRASFGAMAACLATFNPMAGVLVLLGHGAWELSSLVLQSTIDLQQQRISRYNKAFSTLLAQAKAQGTECTEEEMEKARNIFFVHNLIEEICYSALADVVTELKIRDDRITEEQSCLILAHVKEAAHVELRKEGGYTKSGREMITAKQFQGVIRNVATIIHDRDGRLTDARYSTLTDLCTAIDDHNAYVKNVLFRSWLRCESLSSDTHITMIKDLVNFNQRMTAQTGFDFERSLTESKRYYDTRHHNIREIVCPKTGEKSALRFVNLTEVRARFNVYVDELMNSDPETPLTQSLREQCSFTAREVAALMKERAVPCAARFGIGVSARNIIQPPLLREKLTTGNFLKRYFPEKISKQEEVNRAAKIRWI